MRAILIDPELRAIKTIELADKDGERRPQMRELIGCAGMDYGVLDDMRDTIWVDEFGLKRGRPIHAFKFRAMRDPYAGRAIVIGADSIGRSCPPYMPLDFMRREITWLGLIVPEVTWIEETNGIRAVVTYSRST